MDIGEAANVAWAVLGIVTAGSLGALVVVSVGAAIVKQVRDLRGEK